MHLNETFAVDSGTPQRYARCNEASRRVRRHFDADVIRACRFDFGQSFLPERLTRFCGSASCAAPSVA